jgi:hypothetical protein
MADHRDGFQLVPLIFTHDALQDTIDELVAAPEMTAAQCDQPAEPNVLPDDWDFEPPDLPAFGYGPL